MRRAISVRTRSVRSTICEVPHKRLQTRANTALRCTGRRVIVDCEHAHRALAAIIQHLRLAGQVAVAVNAGVTAGRHDISVLEQSARGVVDSLVVFSAAGETGLDERRVDAAVVGQGGDIGRVDRDAVAERQETLAAAGVVD